MKYFLSKIFRTTAYIICTDHCFFTKFSSPTAFTCQNFPCTVLVFTDKQSPQQYTKPVLWIYSASRCSLRISTSGNMTTWENIRQHDNMGKHHPQIVSVVRILKYRNYEEWLPSLHNAEDLNEWSEQVSSTPL